MSMKVRGIKVLRLLYYFALLNFLFTMGMFYYCQELRREFTTLRSLESRNWANMIRLFRMKGWVNTAPMTSQDREHLRQGQK